jgi:hypothetical protein
MLTIDEILARPFAERDAFVDQRLGIEAPPPDADLPRGSVPYLPCGVEEIVAFVRAVPVTRDDTFVDLGAGLGRVAMLVHLLTGARAHGIEIQEHLVRAAEKRARALGLAQVTFEHANVLDAALEGNVFFLYAPFNGPMLARACERLDEVAKERSVTIGTVDVVVDWKPRRAIGRLSIY